jgi:hypothetical protein
MKNTHHRLTSDLRESEQGILFSFFFSFFSFPLQHRPVPPPKSGAVRRTIQADNFDLGHHAMQVLHAIAFTSHQQIKKKQVNQTYYS